MLAREPQVELGTRTRVEPRTDTERALSAIWREVLDVDEIGVLDGFFELGGHSLLATKVIARMRSRFGVEISLRALFDAPTVAALAAVVDRTRGDRVPPAAITGPREELEF